MASSNVWGSLGHKPQAPEQWLRYYGEMVRLCRAERMWTEARQWEQLRDELIASAVEEHGASAVRANLAMATKR